MNYIFPETKFAKENDIGTQSDHVCEEYHEFLDATIGSDEEKEEAMDYYHSLETLFRIWERQGVDMEAVRQKVFEKNRRRGYYYD